MAPQIDDLAEEALATHGEHASTAVVDVDVVVDVVVVVIAVVIIITCHCFDHGRHPLPSG